MSHTPWHKIDVLHQQGHFRAKVSQQTGVSSSFKEHKQLWGAQTQQWAVDERHMVLSSLWNQTMSSSSISSEPAEAPGTQVRPSTVSVTVLLFVLAFVKLGWQSIGKTNIWNVDTCEKSNVLYQNIRPDWSYCCLNGTDFTTMWMVFNLDEAWKRTPHQGFNPNMWQEWYVRGLFWRRLPANKASDKTTQTTLFSWPSPSSLT